MCTTSTLKTAPHHHRDKEDDRNHHLQQEEEQQQQQKQQQKLHDSVEGFKAELRASKNAIPKLSPKMAEFVEQFLLLHKNDDCMPALSTAEYSDKKKNPDIRNNVDNNLQASESPGYLNEDENEDIAAIRRLEQIRLDKHRFKVQAGKAQMAFVNCLLDNSNLEDKLMQVLAIAGIDFLQEENDPAAKMQQVWDQLQHDKKKLHTAAKEMKKLYQHYMRERDDAVIQTVHLKRKIDSLEEEKQASKKEKEAWEKEKQAWEKEKNNLLQEKRLWQQEKKLLQEQKPNSVPFVFGLK